MKSVELKKDIYWVGAVDWDIRNFHGYLTQRGSSYNSYLIMDEKIVLVDSVKHYLYEEMLERIKQIVDPSKIDYIICNHVEMDHSGSIPKIIKLCPNVIIVTSPQGEKGLKMHYDTTNWNFHIVKSGDTINIGTRNIAFLQTPMVHWPDNMVSYISEEKIIFSNDAFGQHIASTGRFDDEVPYSMLVEEARKYYANIVLPYGSQVQKVMEEVKKLDIEIIATSHGIIWRNYIADIVRLYDKWSRNETEKKAVIVYDTMWESTKKMANAIKDAFEDKDYNIHMYNLQGTHISDVMTELITAEYICIGSPTLNSSILPTVAAFLAYMKGLAPKNRKAIAFGSYGWAPLSIKEIEETLTKAGMDVVASEKINFVPTEVQLKELTDRIKKVI
ncbi:MAG TPA: MBL fold metallo-hydrolase [Clostridiales bacterium]|nr:MAG: MBL fold metallo-hydrolase [Clostridiales bacterium GWD2_32_59]HAN10192.1 MBL fold metallo-hydrolase [Clostridiales bacterium]